MRITIRLITSVLAVVITIVCNFDVASAQTYRRQFTAPDSEPGDEFARAVAIDGNVGIFGSPSRREFGVVSGARLPFRRHFRTAASKARSGRRA